MGRIAKGFEGGAKFVPIEGDGNCLFSAVSTYLTCSKNKPLGTPDKHDDIRQKACDYIVKFRNAEPMKSLFSRRRVPIKTDDQFYTYIAKKRSTDGHVYTWSDAITANAVAATCG